MTHSGRNFKAVLLDLDGVLYDSLPQYVQAWSKAFSAVGIEISATDVYQLEGMPGQQTVINIFQKYLNRSPEQNEIDRILKQKSHVLLKFDNRILPGAIELLKSINLNKIPMCVVTGSTKPGIKQEIAKDFSPYLNEDFIINGDDVVKGKPNPDPYLAACKKLAVKPHEALVIENAPLGIRAAVDAGCLCIAVNTGILSNSALKDQGAIAVYNNCQQIIEAWSDLLAE